MRDAATPSTRARAAIASTQRTRARGSRVPTWALKSLVRLTKFARARETGTPGTRRTRKEKRACEQSMVLASCGIGKRPWAGEGALELPASSGSMVWQQPSSC